MSHANAPLTPAGRLMMMRRVETGTPQAHVAARISVSRATVATRRTLTRPSAFFARERSSVRVFCSRVFSGRVSTGEADVQAATLTLTVCQPSAPLGAGLTWREL